MLATFPTTIIKHAILCLVSYLMLRFFQTNRSYFIVIKFLFHAGIESYSCAIVLMQSFASTQTPLRALGAVDQASSAVEVIWHCLE